MPDVTATIDGMHCSGCEERVENRLSRVEGVRSVEADHEKGTATVAFVAGQEDDALTREAVEDLGFDLVNIDEA